MCIRDSNSTFCNNTAIQGGAIYTGDFDYGDPADQAKYQSVVLTDSVIFTGNTASEGLHRPPINADAFTNLKCAETSVTDMHLFSVDSVLTNYDINYLSGDPIDPSAACQVLFQFQSKSRGADGQILELPRQVLDLLPEPLTGPVSYTHLDVYKRQGYGRGYRIPAAGWSAGRNGLLRSQGCGNLKGDREIYQDFCGISERVSSP